MGPADENAMSSVVLLRLLQARDEAAAGAVFERYAQRLTRLARSRLAIKLASRVDPEDIVLSAYRSFFVAAREGRFEIQNGGDLWRLLVEVTLHKLYRQAAHHGAQRRSVAREVPMDHSAATAHADPTPDEALAAAEELEAVLVRLPDRGREALELRLQGYEHEEIAERLACSERTVRRWLDEARRIMATRGGGDFVPSAARRRSALVAAQPAPIAVHIDSPLPWNDFLLHEQIGEGATGKVYRALWRSRNRDVAVKFLKKALVRETGVVERFLREAQIVTGHADPGIVRMYGAGRTPGAGCFLVLEFVRGRDLAQVAQDESATPCQAADWVGQAARIVQAAHEAGVVHCDLKPSNLLLDEDGSIRVTDFGLAVRLADSNIGSSLLAGTPAFMAPEQVDSRWGPISHRTDVYGLGAVLYFLLCNRPPHEGKSVAEVLNRVATNQLVPIPENLVKTAPASLLTVLRKCLAKPIAERYSSAAELGAALAQWNEGPAG
jgi:RNA polymerase sigma factor (sigma-70 family)